MSFHKIIWIKKSTQILLTPLCISYHRISKRIDLNQINLTTASSVLRAELVILSRLPAVKLQNKVDLFTTLSLKIYLLLLKRKKEIK